MSDVFGFVYQARVLTLVSLVAMVVWTKLGMSTTA
jgi:hypothetical protein